MDHRPIGSEPAVGQSTQPNLSLRRAKAEDAIADRVRLESVYGLTVTSNAALDCNSITEQIAYPAGCTVVLYNHRKKTQAHVINTSRKSITCIAFSHDGRYLATGECGHAPKVRVWDFQDPTATDAVEIAELSGHTHGVSFVMFSTSSKHLVSIGSQHDMIVNVWDWKSNRKLASNKVSSRVKAVSFSEVGNYFVTVGFRHVKYWYLDSKNAKYKEAVPLLGRPAILGEQKDNEFCDVVCGREHAADLTFAITRNGLLCEFNSRRMLVRWVNLRTPTANCMAIGNDYIFIGCAGGIVRCLLQSTLEYETTLPRTHYLGVDISEAKTISHVYNHPERVRYPDVIALTYDDRHHKLACVYNDHSFYVWNVRDVKRVTKCHSGLYHSACIWGVDMATDMGDGAFMTCSSDDTIRIWHNNQSTTNIYSKELTKILYIDPDLKYLKDVELTSSNEKDKLKSYDDKTGVRCVRVSPDGLHLASGDRAGNIRIHYTASGLIKCTLEAHDAEVLCLEYCDNPKLLASASRDRLIHIFNVQLNYQLLQTLDDHSSSITAVRFVHTELKGGELKLVSCGADKTILFRQLVTEQDGSQQFVRCVNVSGRTTLYDMEIDVGGRHVLTACQDRNVRVYSTAQGKHTKTFRGTVADDGTLIKLSLDPTGIYLATSSTDKILSVYDYYSGECMATMNGHSEIVTGLRFTGDCEHLISASGDGCVFVWRMPHDMVVTMNARLAQRRARRGASTSNSESDTHADMSLKEPDDDLLPFDINALPAWAARRMGYPVVKKPPPPPPYRGKWAATFRRLSFGRADDEASLDDASHYNKEVQQEPLWMEGDMEDGRKAAAAMYYPGGPDGDIAHNKLRVRSLEASSSASHCKHEGDAEDASDGGRTSSSEQGRKGAYYPGNPDGDIASKFKVTSMELQPPLRAPRTSTLLQTKVTSESDDDEASTPSGGENTDQLPESIERRQMYLKSAFESLSMNDTPNAVCKQSLSSQHMKKVHQSPAEQVEVYSRRREELNRRILATKQQLENVRNASSTRDLSAMAVEDEVEEEEEAARSTQYGFVIRPDDTALGSLNYYDSLNSYHQPPKGRNFHLNLKPLPRSIFKNYKSCPVSPVSEECKWADRVVQSKCAQKRNSLAHGDRGKSIMDTIKSDTEKMIAEITQKYGDLDEYEPTDGNFSSDSLEDCSLSQDANTCKPCRKHTKAAPPRRAISNYEIYGGSSMGASNESVASEGQSKVEHMEQRHSSASFFLNQKKQMKSSCSQESVLSDDMFLPEQQLSRTNCNSLESILSDDSECTKSAPLEMLFERLRPKHSMAACHQCDSTSKSYGSSPNNPPLMDNYTSGGSLTRPPVAKVYGFAIPAHETVTRSRSYYDNGHNTPQHWKGKRDESQLSRGEDARPMVKSKSCTFDVVLQPATKRSSHVQRNLQKFEEQIRRNAQSKQNKSSLNKENANRNNATKSLERGSGAKNNNKIIMEFVAHKPPKPMKRTSSVKLNNRVKAAIDKSAMSPAAISSQYKAKLDGLHYTPRTHRRDKTHAAEKTFQVFIKERDLNENKCEMDSLEMEKQMSMDSLEEPHKDMSTLIGMEGRRMLEEKMLKEVRMRPLKANINDGVVKVLSRKFETLAKRQSALHMKRNKSLPDIGATLNNAVIMDVQPEKLKQRVYNETVIPKTDVHIDSENYESSTTSSSCANSPKRLCDRRGALRKALLESANCVMLSGRMASLANAAAPTAGNRRRLSYYAAEGERGSMRRATSLSDLSIKPTLAPPITAKAKASNKGSKTTRALSKTAKMYFSTSELNNQRQQGLMRPTISSMNKAAAPARKRGTSCEPVSHARGEGSSSEADDGVRARPRNNKSVRPARSRSQMTTPTDSHESIEVAAAAKQACTELSERLTSTASEMVELYETLQQMEPQQVDNGQYRELMQNLAVSMLEAQKVLHKTVLRVTPSTSGAMSSVSSADEEYNESVRHTRSKLLQMRKEDQ